MWLLVLIIGKF